MHVKFQSLKISIAFTHFKTLHYLGFIEILTTYSILFEHILVARTDPSGNISEWAESELFRNLL